MNNNKRLSYYSIDNSHLSSKHTQIPLSKRLSSQIPVNHYAEMEGNMIYSYRYSMTWNLSMVWYYNDGVEMLTDYDE